MEVQLGEEQLAEKKNSDRECSIVRKSKEESVKLSIVLAGVKEEYKMITKLLKGEVVEKSSLVE